MQDTQIVILAGGKGSRMDHPELPKALVPIKGKPMLSYLLETLDKYKDRIVIVVGYKKERIYEQYGDQYKYVYQPEQLGTANAALCAKNLVTTKNVIVLYGDGPFIQLESIEKLAALHEQKQAKITMFSAKVPDFEDIYEPFYHFSRMIRNAEGRLILLKEAHDCTEEEKEIKELNPGGYIFNADYLWENIGKVRNDNPKHEYFLTDVIKSALMQEFEVPTVGEHPLDGFCANTPEHIKYAERIVDERLHR
jgi:bifunctional UDP-N-acetylglucosamine pyrophosphorylase / glucosamine-1-phosphate N-acetyltransferase